MADKSSLYQYKAGLERVHFSFIQQEPCATRLTIILILELTVPTNTVDGLENARRRKQYKQEYGSLINDIVSAGHYSVTYDTIEVGTLGHFTMDSIKSLRKALISRSDNSIKCSRSILTKAAYISVLSSRFIFMAFNTKEWSSPNTH